MLARVLARALCLCPSVTSRCSVEMDGRNNLVFGVGGLLSTSRALYFKKMQVFTRIRALFCGPFF